MGERESSLNLINASGFAFQMAVEHVVKATRGQPFQVAAREHPWRMDDEGGFVDLVLQAGAATWIVECKRTKAARWVFLCEKNAAEPVSRVRCLWIGCRKGPKQIAAWFDVHHRPLSPESAFCVVRGTGEGDKSLLERLSATLVRATDAIASEDISLTLKNADTPSAWGVYLPVIVTTATLEVATFDVSQVTLGEGLLEKAEFVAVPMVRFRKSFRVEPPPNAAATGLGAASREAERTVLVINAPALPLMLAQIAPFKLDEIFDNWPWAAAAAELGLR